jgi:hypothetical protein
VQISVILGAGWCGNSGLPRADRASLRDSARIWQNEYFFPVILRSFPVIEIFFPVIVLVVFGHLSPWMLGFCHSRGLISLLFAFFPVFFPVIGILA